MEKLRVLHFVDSLPPKGEIVSFNVGQTKFVKKHTTVASIAIFKYPKQLAVTFFWGWVSDPNDVKALSNC